MEVGSSKPKNKIWKWDTLIYMYIYLYIYLPSSSGQASQQQSFTVVVQVHNTGRFESFADPVALFQRVDEHKLDADVAAIGIFQTIHYVPQW